MSCRCAPALVALRRQLDAAYPTRDRASDGCCGDPAHRSRKSDHNPTGGYAHAIDIDEDLNVSRNAPLWSWIGDLLADGRTKYVIYERHIFYRNCTTHGAACFDQRGHAYRGANAHDHHLHLSIHTSATHDTTAWVLPTSPATLEDDLTPEQAAQLKKVQDETRGLHGFAVNTERWIGDTDKRIKSIEAKLDQLLARG